MMLLISGAAHEKPIKVLEEQAHEEQALLGRGLVWLMMHSAQEDVAETEAQTEVQTEVQVVVHTEVKTNTD